MRNPPNILNIVSIVILSVIYSINAFSQTDLRVELAIESLNQFINVRDFCISRDTTEVYFTVQSPSQEISQIAYMKKRNGRWDEPQLISFADRYSDLEAFLSPDQMRLYFASNRPRDGSTQPRKDFDIWYVVRKNKNEKWSDPANMGSPVNSDNNEFYPSLSLNNNLYFTSDAITGKGKDDIYVCKYVKGAYLQPEILGDSINTDGYEFNAFVSRNEEFLIYSRYNSEDGVGSGDLYISFKDKAGYWSTSRQLGTSVNTKYMEYCPFYDEENGVLYFTSRREELTPKKFEDITQFKQYVSGDRNGLSKIYKIKIKIER